MKWSGVGAACAEVGVASAAPAASPGVVGHARRERPRRSGWAQSKPASGRLQSIAREVVHDVAAADDQHASLAQRRQRGAELEVVVERLVGVDRELHDRDVGVGEGVHEHRPGAVVDAPAVGVEPDPASAPRRRRSRPRARGRRAPDTRPRTARRGTRRSRGSSGAAAIAVTAVALMYQCAETTRIARGRGTVAPNVRHASV